MVATTSLHATFTCARLYTVTVLYLDIHRYEVMWDAFNIFFYYFTLILFIIYCWLCRQRYCCSYIFVYFSPSFMPLLLHSALFVVNVRNVLVFLVSIVIDATVVIVVQRLFSIVLYCIPYFLVCGKESDKRVGVAYTNLRLRTLWTYIFRSFFLRLLFHIRFYFVVSRVVVPLCLCLLLSAVFLLYFHAFIGSLFSGIIIIPEFFFQLLLLLPLFAGL